MQQELTFYFHIGQAKTGTSAIQAFLNYNREKLAKELGILYPNFHQKDIGSGFCHNHSPFFFQFRSADNYQEVIQYFVECQQYCFEQNIHIVIISWEGFEIELWPGLIRQIEITLNIEIKIILYLRRQDLLYESGWKQWGHKYPEIHCIQEYLVAKDKDHLRYLKNWLVYFTPEQFIVRTFEKSCIGNDVVIDFLKIVGIKDKAGFVEPPANNLNTNAGLTSEVVEILRLCKYMVSDEHDHKILDMVYNSLSERYKKQDPFKTYGFLTLEERKKIMEKYEASNHEVAKIFFGDERRGLFIDPIDEKEVQPVFQGLTIESIVPVFMEIIYNQSQNLNNLRNEIETLKQTMASYARMLAKKSRAFVLIDFKALVCEIIYMNDLSKIKIKRGALWLWANGNDPYFAFPLSIIPDNPREFILDISFPAATTIQVYFSPDKSSGFDEKNSIKIKVAAGRFNVIIPIENLNRNGLLRIDPGQIAGEYIIHQIEIGY